jgi:glycosyltransferase involved in cell wall biosynthesis
MKFLLLNQTFYPDVAATAQYLADLAKALAARGHEVTVICSRRAYDDPATLFKKCECWNGIRILRVRSSGCGKSTKWRRIFDFATFILFCSLRAIGLRRQDTIVVLTSPPLISLVGLVLARIWRSRFVYWVMDLNPDEAVAAGWLAERCLCARLLERASRLCLNHASQVIVLDRFMANRVAQKLISPRRITAFSPWSHDPEVCFDAQARQRFRLRHGLDGKFVVMYSGNHSPCHPLTTVIEAVDRLADQPDVAFCFIGGGSEFRKIRRFFAGESSTSNRRFPNVRCLDYLPLAELSASLSAADLHVVVHGNDFVGIVHPCKIYNILRVCAPLVYIGPEPSPVSDILSQAKGQVVCASLRHGDVDGLVCLIQELRSKWPNNGLNRDPSQIVERFSKRRILPGLVEHLEWRQPEVQQVITEDGR